MKTRIITTAILFSGLFLNAQQINVGEYARAAKFSKTIDEINSGKSVLKYSDIQGNPFYKNGFAEARIGDTGTTILPVRYNMYKDAFEILNNSDIYAIPKDNAFSKFVYISTNEKFILTNDDEGIAGYFLVLADGKNKLLKKIAVKFSPEVPAPNTLIPGTPAKFENQRPIYYIKTDDNVIKLTKKSEDLLNALPSDKKDSAKDFIKTKKIKFNQELDLIALANFLNN
jgi:hypothetical protein